MVMPQYFLMTAVPAAPLNVNQLKGTLMEEVLLSQLAGYDHQTLNCLILIVMISMCPQHLVYSRWQSQSMVVVIALWLLWLRTPVMYAWALHSPSPFQPETSGGRTVHLLLHPTPSVRFDNYCCPLTTCMLSWCSVTTCTQSLKHWSRVVSTLPQDLLEYHPNQGVFVTVCTLYWASHKCLCSKWISMQQSVWCSLINWLTFQVNSNV